MSAILDRYRQPTADDIISGRRLVDALRRLDLDPSGPAYVLESNGTERIECPVLLGPHSVCTVSVVRQPGWGARIGLKGDWAALTAAVVRRVCEGVEPADIIHRMVLDQA